MVAFFLGCFICIDLLTECTVDAINYICGCVKSSQRVFRVVCVVYKFFEQQIEELSISEVP